MNQNYQTGFQGGLTYSMQNLSMEGGANVGTQTQHLIDGSMMVMNSHRSAGSDSGSSIGSSGDISPPETPTLMTNSNQHLRLSADQLSQPPPTTPQQKHLQQQQQQQQQQMSYGKQMNLTRLNGGRTDKSNNSGLNNNNNVGSSGATIIYASTAGAHPAQQIYATGNELILAPAGSVSNSGNSSNNPNVSSNNNMNSNAVLMSSGVSGNSANSTTVLLQTHQGQYNTSYPYHPIATSTALRPPIMTQTGMAPPQPPPNNFRLPSNFQLPPPPPNGELLYPAYHHHPSGITFLSSTAVPPPVAAAPPPPQTVAMRSGNVMNTNAVSAGGTLPSQQSMVAAVSPYALVSGSVNKPMSCYNCGSQTHSGRDCQSPSMDDATRGGVYKLDYSVAAQSANSSLATTTSTTNQNELLQQQKPTQLSMQQQQQQQQHNITETHTANAATPTGGGGGGGGGGSSGSGSSNNSSSSSIGSGAGLIVANNAKSI